VRFPFGLAKLLALPLSPPRSPTSSATGQPGTLSDVSDDIWVDIAGGKYVGQQPSKRFPIYTRGNAGEVYPEVLYPLTFSTSLRDSGQAGIRALLQVGVIGLEEVANDDTAVIAVLGGYSYLNLSIVRLAATRTPGQTVADVDFQYYGKSDAPPHIAHKGDRSVGRSIAVLRYALRVLKLADDPQMDIDAAQVDRWRASLPDRSTATDAELLHSIRSAIPMILGLFEHHLAVSNKAAVPLGVLAQTCKKQLGDPQLTTTLLSGLGNVESAGPALALWKLGRQVKSSDHLTGAFNRGADDLALRMRADQHPDAVAFMVAFDAFLEVHGCRGPNEWETACDTWGTNQALPLALIDRLRGADESHDPVASVPELRSRRLEATRTARAKLKPWQRKRFDNTLRAAGAYSQRREQAKTTVIRAIHEVRLTTLELDRRVRERSGEGTPKDIWFVVEPELDEYLANPAAFRDRIAERRAMRALLATREPPFIINGVVPPFDTWAIRSENTVPAAVAGQQLSGIPGCPGVARGRAVVVLDPSDPREIGPGDVLVAPLTDPSWTPLFLAAEAVVVDVGAVLSHAVIVSRELSIPCVVSVTNATKSIRDGAIIEVDGTSGIVTVIEMP
jgi:rifampicin phosphotransferase